MAQLRHLQRLTVVLSMSLIGLLVLEPAVSGRSTAAAEQPAQARERDEERPSREVLQRRAVILAQSSGWVHAYRAWAPQQNEDARQRAKRQSPTLRETGVPRPRLPRGEEWDRLLQGWTVSRPIKFELGGRTYVGGAAFQIIEASPPEILSTLTDAQQLPLALPNTRAATELTGERASPSARRSIELIQGTSLFKARYTVSLEAKDEHTLQFALEDGRDHDIRDARGFFTAHRLSSTHSLVSVFVAVDLGSGVGRSLLKRPVQNAVLSAAAHIRAYVEPRARR